jgi:HAD superfamily hydrolase (TIGR01450 family)
LVLRPVDTAEAAPEIVLQGYGPEVGWHQMAEATVAIRAGATWVATNADLTLPSPRGPLPGNGALIAAIATALGRPPDTIVGKPDPALFVAAARERQAKRPLVVGDRLDTDIEGANRAGMDSLLVFTGVSTADDLAAAPPERRPTYVAADLSALFESGAKAAYGA